MHNHALASLHLLFSPARAGQVRDALSHYRNPCDAWLALLHNNRSLGHCLKDKTRLIERGLNWLQQPGCALIGWHQDAYPTALRHVPSPPPFLFIKGRQELLWAPQVAIVGTRNPSAAGAETARYFALCLAESGYTVTSGLATGIDSAAHEGALQHGTTVAALATGPDLVFPASNEALYARISQAGVIITEHAPGVPALRSHFPARNRLIAGLSQGTLVIEAAIRSGALITARLAAELGKEVMAVPGSIHNPVASGCHQLIREGAHLVAMPEEVAQILALSSQNPHLPQMPFAHTTPNHGTLAANPGELNSTQQQVWRALGHDSVAIDTLCLRTGLTAADISSILIGMELAGWVENHAGRYHRGVYGTASARG